MTLDMNSLLSGVIGSILGAFIALVSSIIIQKRNWANQQKIEDDKRIARENELRSKFFMELNYNKRKIIYAIENEKFKLTSLDNFHWKEFIYSRASHILIPNKKLINELAELDSMVDQANDRIQSINKAETAFIFSGDTAMKVIYGKLQESLKDYLKNDLKPKIETAIEELDTLFKNS